MPLVSKMFAKFAVEGNHSFSPLFEAFCLKGGEAFELKNVH